VRESEIVSAGSKLITRALKGRERRTRRAQGQPHKVFLFCFFNLILWFFFVAVQLRCQLQLLAAKLFATDLVSAVRKRERKREWEHSVWPTAGGRGKGRGVVGGVG